MSNDDWRVTVTFTEQSGGGRLRKALHVHEVDDEARELLGDRVVVSEADGVVFLYTTTRESAREAERVVRGILAAYDLDAELAIDRWHPIEERWEDEQVLLPASESEAEAEEERRELDEIAVSEELGGALWEVRIELDSRRDAVALADRLEAEAGELLPGWTFSVLRRWNCLLIGADTEDQAGELARALQAQLPPGATLQVEPSGALVWKTLGNRAFAVLGGLGA
jgi:hypothetical protein